MTSTQSLLLDLDPNLGVSKAPDLFEQLQSHLSKNIQLNAAHVNHLDAPCAQILVSAKEMWSAQGWMFEVVNHSDAFQIGLKTLSLDSHFPPNLEPDL